MLLTPPPSLPAAFLQVLRSMRLDGELLTDAEIEDLMATMDLDGDGLISYEEFCQGMRVRY